MKRYFPDPRDARQGTAVSAQGLANAVDVMQRTLHGKGVKTRIGGQMVIQGGGERGSGGSSLAISTVLVLPAIPTTGGRFVFWTSSGGGTGDDQIWVAHAGQTAWTPVQKPTTKSGTPAS